MITPLALLGGSIALVLVVTSDKSKPAPEPSSGPGPSAGTCVVQVPPTAFQGLVIDFVANYLFELVASAQLAADPPRPDSGGFKPGQIVAVTPSDVLPAVPPEMQALPTIKGCTSQPPATFKDGDKVVPPRIVTVAFAMPNGLSDLTQLMPFANKDTLQMILPVAYAMKSEPTGTLELAEKPRSGAIPDAWPLRAFLVGGNAPAQSGLGAMRRRRR